MYLRNLNYVKRQKLCIKSTNVYNYVYRTKKSTLAGFKQLESLLEIINGSCSVVEADRRTGEFTHLLRLRLVLERQRRVSWTGTFWFLISGLLRSRLLGWWLVGRLRRGVWLVGALRLMVWVRLVWRLRLVVVVRLVRRFRLLEGILAVILYILVLLYS